MIGACPVTTLAPLDYRYALDAALALLAGKPTLVRCDLPELASEVGQRISQPAATDMSAALWIEPSADRWQDVLASFTLMLPVGTLLVVIASRPLAQLLPERRAWSGQPLGIQHGGIGRLRRALVQSQFRLEATYGIHSVAAIALNMLSQRMERLGRPDLGDRLHFAARLRYCATGPAASLAAVALLSARKVGTTGAFAR